VEVLVRARTAAARFDPEVKIRIGSDGAGSVVFELADQPEDGDSSIVLPEGVILLVQSGLVGVVDAGEHDTLVLRPGV
jgi:hypothetical protein